jgi:hypothetical protein
MKICRPALLTLLLFVVHSTALAQQSHPLLTEKYQLWLGIYFPDMDSKIGIDGSSGVQDHEIDFEGQLRGSDDDEIFAGSFLWQFGEKWGLQTQYFDSTRGSSTSLTQDIEWGDYILKEGSNLSAGLDLTILRVFFGREFSRGENYVFGAGAGIHWMEFELFAEGEFFLNDESTGFRREAVKAEAPLPNIGAWYVYSFSPKWAFAAKLDWLSASIDEYSGGLLNTAVGVNYQPFENVGIGANYQFFRLDGDVKNEGWRGSMEIDFHGPLIYASFSW